MNYSGIDLHANNNLVSITDEEDHVVAERRLPPMSVVSHPLRALTRLTALR